MLDWIVLVIRVVSRKNGEKVDGPPLFKGILLIKNNSNWDIRNQHQKLSPKMLIWIGSVIRVKRSKKVNNSKFSPLFEGVLSVAHFFTCDNRDQHGKLSPEIIIKVVSKISRRSAKNCKTYMYNECNGYAYVYVFDSISKMGFSQKIIPKNPPPKFFLNFHIM